MEQFKETMLDSRAWFIFMFGVLVTMQSPVLTFATLMINRIGYSKLQTMLFTAPSGAVQICFIWIGVALCKIFPKNRVLVVWILNITPLVGCVLLLKLPSESRWGVIVAAWLVSLVSNPKSRRSQMANNLRRLVLVLSCPFFYLFPLPTSREIQSALLSTQCSSLATAQDASDRLSYGPKAQDTPTASLQPSSHGSLYISCRDCIVSFALGKIRNEILLW